MLALAKGGFVHPRDSLKMTSFLQRRFTSPPLLFSPSDSQKSHSTHTLFHSSLLPTALGSHLPLVFQAEHLKQSTVLGCIQLSTCQVSELQAEPPRSREHCMLLSHFVFPNLASNTTVLITCERLLQVLQLLEAIL